MAYHCCRLGQRYGHVVKSTTSAYFGYDEFGGGLYDSDKQGIIHAEENGPYLTAPKFYNTLYQKGLLDPDSQTQGYDGMVEDYQNGTAFLNVFNFLGSSLYNSEAHTAEGKMMAPCPPSEAEPIAYGQNIYGGNRPWTIVQILSIQSFVWQSSTGLQHQKDV
ncbi:MAG: hypothetical protein ACLRZ6_01605 [Lachnospiraceae bacterium]